MTVIEDGGARQAAYVHLFLPCLRFIAPVVWLLCSNVSSLVALAQQRETTGHLSSAAVYPWLCLVITITTYVVATTVVFG